MSRYELTGIYISKDELQGFLDDIDRRLTALDNLGGSGISVTERVTMLEEVHQCRATYRGTAHAKGRYWRMNGRQE